MRPTGVDPRAEAGVPDAATADLTALARAAGFTRIIGSLRGEEPGPTLLCTASLHGNEPAGALALARVFRALGGEGKPVRGEIVGLVGNLGALALDQRFIAFDLNRGWLPDRLDNLLALSNGRELEAEEAEQVELIGEMRAVFERARGTVHLIDLHTTSGESPPFGTLGDTLRNRAFARDFPVPMVLGLEEQLEGAMLEWVGNLGHITMGFEGGQHDDPASVDHIESVVLIATHKLGIARMPEQRVAAARDGLLRAARSYPGFVEVRYRHGIPEGSEYVMEPGWRSFQNVRRGQVLGHHDAAPVTAPEAGRMLMPLYQAQGDDGFFLIRDVRPVWLAVSAILRRLRADRIARLLPGVRRHPENADAVIVDRQRARWFAIEIFHLLGYRRRQERGMDLVMSRRHFDEPPRLRMRGRKPERKHEASP